MLLWAILACSDAPMPSDSAASPGPDASIPWPVACAPVVAPPVPLAGGDPAPADPHQDVLGAEPTPFQVRYGWPSVDPSTSASFLWRTDPDTLATVVEYGVDGALTERAEGASFVFGATSSSAGHRIHEIKLCDGLQPGTTYSYRVGGDGAWSPTYTFTTPAAPGTFDTVRVAFAGDSRGSYEAWAEVFAAMASHDPDFFVFTGDMVALGPNQTEWEAWFEATGDVLAGKALLPAHGNHEFLATNYFAQFSLPNNEQWFHVRYGDLILASLNDTVSDPAHTAVDQVAYLDHALAEDARWRVVAHHQTMYSTSSAHGSDLGLRALWEPVLDRHGVDLVVAGHNHVYERSVPIRGGAAHPDGAIHLVSGGAGAPLYKGFTEQWFGEVAIAEVHYVIADFGPAGVNVVARDLAGNVLDSFSIPR